MPELPSHANLDQLRHQARELLKATNAGDETAQQRIATVSDRVNLTAAQLAIAREYGLASWRELVAEVTKRRGEKSRSGGAAVIPERSSGVPSWSAGPPITLAAGILRPHGVVLESGRAVLRVGLDVSEQPPGVMEPRWARWLTMFRPALRGKAPEAAIPRLDTLTVVDSRGSTYACREDGGGGYAQVVGRRRIPRHADFQLHLDPTPDAGVEWIELAGEDGTRTRLVRGGLAEARVVGPTPTSSTGGPRRVESIALRLIAMRLNGAPIGDRFLVEQSAGAMAQVAEMETVGSGVSSELKQELSDLCRFLSEGTGDDHGLRPAWKAMLDAGGLRDGLRPSADLDVSLPSLGGITVEVRTLLFEDDSWSLTFRAEPEWWRYSEDGHQKSQPITFVAGDDVGGTYAHLGAGGSRAENGYDLSVRFRPRLAPEATRLRLLARASREQVEIDISLPLL